MINDITAPRRRPPNVVQTNSQPIPPRFYARSAPVPVKKRRLPQWLQITLLIPAIMLGSIFIQSAALGQAAIALFGIVAWIWRIPSRVSFGLALFAMVMTTVLLVGRGNAPLAQNFATYTFLFLVVGVITLSRELKKEGGRIYSSRK